MRTFFKIIFIIASNAVALMAFYYTYLTYDLYKDEIVRRADPLLQYVFSKDQEAFVVSGGSDVEIREVSWLLPSVPSGGLSRLNEHPRILKLRDVEERIARDAEALLAEFPEGKKSDFIHCYLLGEKYSEGIPLTAEVTFRLRGDKDVRLTTDLLYAQFSNGDNPFIEVARPGVSSKELSSFTARALRSLKERFNVSRQISASVGENQNCGEKLPDDPSASGAESHGDWFSFFRKQSWTKIWAHLGLASP